MEVLTIVLTTVIVFGTTEVLKFILGKLRSRRDYVNVKNKRNEARERVKKTARKRKKNTKQYRRSKR